VPTVNKNRHLINTLFAWNDQLWALLATFLILFVLVIAVVKKTESTEADTTAGNMSVEIKWTYDTDIDVDLWVLKVGDFPIWYNNKDTNYGNLVKDDMNNGSHGKENYENIFIRKLDAGEYVVNVHLFSDHQQVLPVPVKVRVVMRPTQNAHNETVFDDTIILKKYGEERTAIRFTLDSNGKIIDRTTLSFPMVYKK
jgi:heme/copper-type cytochrome/quinol oxidase subunit 2